MEAAAQHGGTGAAATLFVLLIVVPVVALSIYLPFSLRKRARGSFSGWHIVSFAAGTALLVAAMSPPVSSWAHHDLRGHMVQHLLLGMFAPLALVLGAPGTLLLRNVQVRVARRIARLLGTLPVRCLVHPATAALLDIGGMYVLYLTPLYALSLSAPVVHVLLHVHFVLAGYLFAWAIAGPDPAPHRPAMTTRLAVLFLATAAHANLGKIMYGYGFPRGIATDPGEIQAAAQWMYYGGDLAELMLAVAFFALWFRRRTVAGSHRPRGTQAPAPATPVGYEGLPRI